MDIPPSAAAGFPAAGNTKQFCGSIIAQKMANAKCQMQLNFCLFAESKRAFSEKMEMISESEGKSGDGYPHPTSKKLPFFLQLQRIGNVGEKRDEEPQMEECDSVAKGKRKKNLYFLM